MKAVIFIGLQGAGKSTFYKERFFTSHVRISLDLLKTRNRERRMLDVCFDTQQPFVVDNTNPSLACRADYIGGAKRAHFTVIGYYFRSRVEDCLMRNQQRHEQVPDVGILSTAKKLEIPRLCEGFDELNYVRIESTGFVVEEWNDEI